MNFLTDDKIQKLWRKKAGEVPTQSIGQRGFSRGRRFFEELVREAVEALPQELRNRLENVAIIVEEEPPGRTSKRRKNRQELLGLYHGISQKDRGFWYGNVLPDRIIIYRKPLERISVSSQDLKKNVRETVVHEVGHFFGFDEKDLQRLEEEEILRPREKAAFRRLLIRTSLLRTRNQRKGQVQGVVEQRGHTWGYFFRSSDSRSIFMRLAMDTSQAMTSAISLPIFSCSPRR